MGNEFLLPTMRHAIYCPHCDYYLTIKYAGVKTCPWCGTTYKYIPGDKGENLEEGNIWTVDAPELAKKVIKKFFKIYAIGNVDVWALTGTAIKTDAYFWRHQAPITNGIKKQINAKIGKKVGRIYDFGGTTTENEFTLGYPDSIGIFQ
ncbi:MAG: hypothetical protein IKP65_02270 [Alphaproteobacteria bacterium]|nr:hypothetical protein [Alphaproteobacteria bacterium]